MTEQIVNVDRIEQIIDLFGSFDENIRILESEYDVRIVNRDTELKITGEAENVLYAKQAVESGIVEEITANIPKMKAAKE